MRYFTQSVDEVLMINGRIQVKVLEVNSQSVLLAIINPDSDTEYQEVELFIGDTDDSQTEGDEMEVPAYSCHVLDEFDFSDEEDTVIIPV